MEMKEEVKTERVEKLINNSEILYRKTLAQFKVSWQIDCIITWCHGCRFLLTSNFEQSVCQKYRELKDFLQPINCSCFNESDLIIIWFAFVLRLDQRHDAKTLRGSRKKGRRWGLFRLLETLGAAVCVLPQYSWLLFNSSTYNFCFLCCRKLVEQTMMEHENTKEARRKLQEYKQKLGENVTKRSKFVTFL